ncbi:hypothetical protein NDU88_006682 [Pleurodeles waltl]|uniref:Uncharacterized protein n=1 Tax=Pleurodeles waltl TaxID=8319 RepID=A0AAV7NQX5_PLEWA|nr:hypothetical protein NDU88_006682 [Pleurodeles waltl]
MGGGLSDARLHSAAVRASFLRHGAPRPGQQAATAYFIVDPSSGPDATLCSDRSAPYPVATLCGGLRSSAAFPIGTVGPSPRVPGCHHALAPAGRNCVFYKGSSFRARWQQCSDRGSPYLMAPLHSGLRSSSAIPAGTAGPSPQVPGRRHTLA